MKTNTFLAVPLLLAFGGAIPTSQGAPRAKPAPQPQVPQKLTPADIESLREKAEQIRQARRKAIATQREAEAAILRQSNLSPQDWSELFRNSEASRKTIQSLLERLPVSVMEQGDTGKIKAWLGEIYKAICPQMAPRTSEPTLGLLVQDRLSLRLVAIQCATIEVALLRLKTDLTGQKALLAEVDASILAIRATCEQSQVLMERMAGKPSAPKEAYCV